MLYSIEVESTNYLRLYEFYELKIKQFYRSQIILNRLSI